eukprot:8503294-Heterocapsa_arctica.AAC.1
MPQLNGAKKRSSKLKESKGDGNCLYTCLGKSRNLNGDQVRQILVEKAAEHWNQTMDYDADGSGLEHFIKETQDRKEWGGYEQIAAFARNFKITLEIMSFGNHMLTYDGAEEIQDKERIRVLLCNTPNG